MRCDRHFTPAWNNMKVWMELWAFNCRLEYKSDQSDRDTLVTGHLGLHPLPLCAYYLRIVQPTKQTTNDCSPLVSSQYKIRHVFYSDTGNWCGSHYNNDLQLPDYVYTFVSLSSTTALCWDILLGFPHTLYLGLISGWSSSLSRPLVVWQSQGQSSSVGIYGELDR